MSDHLSHLKKQKKNHFVTKIETESFEKGLNEDVVKRICEKRNEPEWLLKKRLRAFHYWKQLKEPHWPSFDYPPLNYQDICYYSAPKAKKAPKSLDDIDPELLKTLSVWGFLFKSKNVLVVWLWMRFLIVFL